MNQNEITEGKTLAVVSYFTFIGLIIAMIMNLEKKNAFVHFHCRQMLGLILMLIFFTQNNKSVTLNMTST